MQSRLSTLSSSAAALAVVSLGCFTPVIPNPCALNNGGCSFSATCTVNVANEAICSCNGGFVGNGKICTPEQSGPCSTDNGGCDAHATCAVTSSGGVICSCNPGYQGNGTTCVPAEDACLQSPCDPNATCAEAPDGGAACTCRSGYHGDGLVCVPNSGSPCSPDPCGAFATCSTGALGQAVCTCEPGYTGTNGQNCAPDFLDAGVPDAGMQIDPNSIGGPCLSGGTTCDNGLTCYGVSDQNMCSEVCSQDADCAAGEINGLPGICNGGICFPSCDPSATSPCERDDFACLPYTSTTNICLPNCGVQAEASFCNDFFGYPFSECNQLDGSCFDEAACSVSMPCSAGEACVTAGSGTSAKSVCVNSCAGTPSGSCTSNTDCPLSACLNGTCQNCPFGFACDTGQVSGGALNTCSPSLVGDYALCESQAQCTQPSNSSLQEYCVAFASPPDAGPPTTNLCMQTCNATSDCPMHETCTINLGSVTVCGWACSTAGVTCPTGTTCQSLGSLGKYCAP